MAEITSPLPRSRGEVGVRSTLGVRGIIRESNYAVRPLTPTLSPRERGEGEERSSEIAIQHAAIDSCQFLQIGNRRTLVDLVHGLADQAELDHRAIAGDEARIRGAARGAQ